jgi:hypothetical protein
MGKEKLKEAHNPDDNLQGVFRKAALDFTLMRYAVDVLQGVDEIAVTHADKAWDSLNVVCEYDMPPHMMDFIDAHGRILVNRDRDYEYQCRLTEALNKITPDCFYNSHYVWAEFPILIEHQIQRWGGHQATVSIESFGPRTGDKRDL